MRRNNNPFDLLPKSLRNEEDIESLDSIIDHIAAITRWSNADVASAICKLIHHIVNESPRGNTSLR